MDLGSLHLFFAVMHGRLEDGVDGLQGVRKALALCLGTPQASKLHSNPAIWQKNGAGIEDNNKHLSVYLEMCQCPAIVGSHTPCTHHWNGTGTASNAENMEWNVATYILAVKWVTVQYLSDMHPGQWGQSTHGLEQSENPDLQNCGRGKKKNQKWGRTVLPHSKLLPSLYCQRLPSSDTGPACSTTPQPNTHPAWPCHMHVT